MLNVKDLKTLRKLKTNNKIGEIAIVEENRMLYKWDGTSWHHHKSPKGINMSMYELNQSAIFSLPEISFEDLEKAKTLIQKFKNDSHNSYYMLLNNDKHYYTIFKIKKSESLFENEVIECLQSQGIIKSIESCEQGIECWISDENNAYVYYLFPYDEGVIICQ